MVRLDLSQFKEFYESNKTFSLGVEIIETESGWKDDYMIESFSVVNVKKDQEQPSKSAFTL